MESLSYPFEERGLLFTDDAEFQVDGLSRSRNLSKKRDGEPLHFPIRDAIEGMGFMEPHLPDTARNSVFSNHVLGSSADDSMDHTVTLNSLMEFGTRVSSSANRAGDEKLAGNPTEPNGNRFSIDSSVLPSPEPSVSAKRARITSSHSQIPTCQVHGCNKDLTSSKGYHKRHKVCDVHSKTAVVIVNGIRQRFCQQCSRFHILSEFDEGKRSCRKRLAGHNERRRKPQFHPHLGSTYYTMDAAKTSLLFSRILPGGFLGLTCNEPSHFKLEEEPNQISQLAPHMKFGESVHLHGMGGQHPAKNCLDSNSPIPELYVGSNSSCALSLLSAQSQNSLTNSSAGMSMAHPLIPPPNHPADLSTLQNSTKHTPKNVAFSSSGADRKEIPMVPHAIFSADIKPSQESDLKSCQSPEGANTVDLLELSLHLQRVERQKQDTQIRR